MTERNKTLVLVDFDDTLIYSGGIWLNANKIQFAKYGIEYNNDEFYAKMAHGMFDETVQMIHREYLPQVSIETIEAELVESVIDQYDHCELNHELIEFVKHGAVTGGDIRIFTANKQYIIEPSLKRMGLEMLDVHHCTGKYRNKTEMLRDIIKECPDVKTVIVIDDNEHVRRSVTTLHDEFGDEVMIWAYPPDILKIVKSNFDVIRKMTEKVWDFIVEFVEQKVIADLVDEARKSPERIPYEEIKQRLESQSNSNM